MTASLPPERPVFLTASETIALNDLFRSMGEAEEQYFFCECDFHLKVWIGYTRLFDDFVRGNCRIIQ